MMLAVLRGREAEARGLIDLVRREASALGQGVVVQLADWMFALLCNSLSLYDEAVEHVQEDRSEDLVVSVWTAMEVLEAATRVVSPCYCRSRAT